MQNCKKKTKKYQFWFAIFFINQKKNKIFFVWPKKIISKLAPNFLRLNLWL